jgi:peptidoglycan/LPS O-acetylase OafA/YrhL
VAYLGVISYSLYLVHLIVVSKVMNLSKRVVTIDSLWVMPVVLLATVAAIVTGVLFYRFIEAPLERWRKGVGRRARGEAVVAGQRYWVAGKRNQKTKRKRDKKKVRTGDK